MKALNIQLLAPSVVNATTTSAKCSVRDIYALSAQIIVGAGTIGGTLAIQVSDDPNSYNNMALPDFTPTNWSTLGTPTTLSAAGVTLIPKVDMSYQWLRALYTNTVVMVDTIVAVADIAGSLNNKYFTFSSLTINYYVWFNVSGGGVDPALPGKTGIEVDITSGDSANTVGAAMRTALGSPAGYTTSGANATAIITLSSAGHATVPADGAAPTGFAISSNDPTASITVNINAQGF